MDDNYKQRECLTNIRKVISDRREKVLLLQMQQGVDNTTRYVTDHNGLDNYSHIFLETVPVPVRMLLDRGSASHLVRNTQAIPSAAIHEGRNKNKVKN